MYLRLDNVNSMFVIENNFHTLTHILLVAGGGDAAKAGFLAEKYLVNYSPDCTATAINKLLKYLNQLDQVLVFGAIKY